MPAPKPESRWRRWWRGRLACLLRREGARRLWREAQRFSLPGFDGVPLLDVGRFFWEETRRDRLTIRASAMAFSFLLATFPGLLFLFTLLPFIPVQNLDRTLMTFLAELMPAEALSFVHGTVQDIVRTQRLDLLSAGFLLTFFFSTNGVNAMIAAFNKQHPNYVKRSFWQLRLVSIKLTFFILLLFIGSLVTIIGGRAFLGWMEARYPVNADLALHLLAAFRWIVIFLLYFGVISLIYHDGPARKKKWTFITAGSTLATVLGILATLGFGYVVNRFGRYNELYGSLGALIVFMVWMNLNTFVLLVGFELNNAIDMNRFLRRQRRPSAEGHTTPVPRD
jgi:membrane protein